MKARTINPAEIAILGLILTVTVVFLVDLRHYAPGAQLVPALFIGVTLVLLIARVAVIALGLDRPTSPKDDPPGDAPTGFGRWRVLVVTCAVACYLLLILFIGLYPAVLVFVAGFARLVGGIGLAHSAILGGATCLSAYLIFDTVLGLPSLAGVLFG